MAATGYYATQPQYNPHPQPPYSYDNGAPQHTYAPNQYNHSPSYSQPVPCNATPSQDASAGRGFMSSNGPDAAAPVGKPSKSERAFGFLKKQAKKQLDKKRTGTGPASQNNANAPAPAPATSSGRVKSHGWGKSHRHNHGYQEEQQQEEEESGSQEESESGSEQESESSSEEEYEDDGGDFEFKG